MPGSCGAARPGGSAPAGSGAPRGTDPPGARRPAAGRPYREGGELLGRHGGEQLRQQQQQRHPHPEAAAAGTQRLREAEEGDSPGDVAPPPRRLLWLPFQSLPLGGPSSGPLFSSSPPHPLKLGDGSIAERRQFLPLSVPPSLPEGQPRLGDAPHPLLSRRPPAAQGTAGGDPPDPAASPGAPRLPPPGMGCCLALGVACFPLQPRLPRGGGSGRKRLGREGRTLPHHPSGVRRRRGAAGRHCRGCGGWRCATSPSRSSPFPLILPPPQPGLRFLLPDPQILAD